MSKLTQSIKPLFSRGVKLCIAALTLAMISTQALNITPVLADDGGYPWVGAGCIDGTNCSSTYNWGYTLTNGQCPSVDTSCLTYPYPNGTNPTAGMGDPWHMGVRNCTSYVAWKLNQVFNQNIISASWQNANYWNTYATGHSYTDDTSPQVGDIAQWDGTQSNPYGHVAYVFAVNGSVASFDEYNSGYPKSGNNLQWGLFYSGFTSANYPSPVGPPNHYIHIGTPVSPSSSPSTPAAVSRSSSSMDVFYNDGNNSLVNYGWNSTTGWSSHSMPDTTNGVSGQPAVISRTSDSMDVFYYTPNHKLMNDGWTASGGWSGPTPLLTSGVYGDPAVVARDSTDIQVFFSDNSGNIKSIYWTASGGWNTTLQQLYGPGGAGDPYAITRTSDSMDVFFVKNNENLVHLGWTSAYGWNSSDWTTYMVGKPTAITWNSGNDMAAFYDQINGHVGEENWDSSTGWAGQTWTASLSGNPSAVAGVSNTIDNFYRETGGNIVDRYLSSGTWATTNVVGSNSSTSNPFAITRGTTNEEVFYWNGTNLEDANWNTTSQSWSPATIN